MAQFGDPAIARALQAMFGGGQKPSGIDYQPGVGGANPNYTRNFGQANGDFGDMSPVVAGLGPNAIQPLDRGGSPYQSSAEAQGAIARLLASMNPNYTRGHAGMVDQDLAPGEQPEMGAADIIGLPAAIAFALSRGYKPGNPVMSNPPIHPGQLIPMTPINRGGPPPGTATYPY